MEKEESKLMIQEYAKNPINNYSMQDADIQQHEGNIVCGDDITVYIKFDQNKIKDFSFDGNCSTTTLASASFLSEKLKNQNIQKIITWNYNTLKQEGFIVSKRRENAAIIPLLATINAIYKRQKEDTKLDFEDLL